MPQFRNFVFTLNNYTEEQVELLKESEVKYLIFGKEIGKENNTPHLQGYIELDKAKTYGGVKKLLKIKGIHLENRKGTQKQAIEYCKKEGKWFEFGEKKKQGSRTDIQLIKNMVKEGKKMSVIVEEATNFQDIRIAEKLKQYLSPKRNFKPIVIWCYGSTGKGKTRAVYDVSDDIYNCLDGKWFDGYESNEIMLIDDYRLDFMKFHKLLRFTDRYDYKLEIKGGTTQLYSKIMIFTSPNSPSEMWDNRTEEDLCQLNRRLTEVINIDEIGYEGYKKKLEQYLTEVRGNTKP